MMKMLMDKKSLKNTLKFAGPLKLLVIEPSSEYYKTVGYAAALGLINVMVGAVNMASFLYSVTVGDPHAVICTFAYHFLSAEAVLSLNIANGWSTPMRLKHRKLIHISLQICAMICAAIGTTLVLITKWPVNSAHGIAGVITTALASVTLLSGPCGLFGNRLVKLFHVTIGVTTFLVSSVCICLGFFTDSFNYWSHVSVKFVLTSFVVCCSTYIVITVFLKWFN